MLLLADMLLCSYTMQQALSNIINIIGNNYSRVSDKQTRDCRFDSLPDCYVMVICTTSIGDCLHTVTDKLSWYTNNTQLSLSYLFGMFTCVG